VVKVKFALEQVIKAQRGSRGALFIGDWWDSVAIWTGAENLTSTASRSQDRSAHSESL
jgi:hypothetical protein